MSPFERRDVVRVTGPDAQKYLQGQLSQDVARLGVGGSVWSLLLEPTGKFGFLVRVTREAEDSFAVDVDGGAEAGEAVFGRLRRFLLRTKAELSRDVWVVDVSGEAAGRPLVHWWATEVTDSHQSIVDDADPAALAIGQAEAVRDARVLAGWPSNGAEVADGGIPGETGVVDVAASFTKGCYTGQELVARIDSRANNLPRRVRRVELTAPASPGDEVFVDGEAVGTITSVGAKSSGRALAIVGRRVDTLPTAAVVNGNTATIAEQRQA